MTLRSLPLPNQGLLAWSDPTWLQYILPADSLKKRLLRGMARHPAFVLLSRCFDGTLPFNGEVYDLDDLLASLSDIAPDPAVSAVFVNSKRNPPRVYVWLRSGDKTLFLKIGRETELSFFENEVEALAQLHPIEDMQVMRPLALRKHDGLTLLLSQGMSLSMQRNKRRLNPEQVLAHFARQKLEASGFFGGLVHGDLASHNVFKLGDRLLIVDWEFAATSGPDYCDLIELGAALVVSNTTQRPDLDTLNAQLRRSAGARLDDSTLLDSLVFLAERGNINARTVLSSVYSFKRGQL